MLRGLMQRTDVRLLRPRFRLATLFILIALFSVPLGIHARREQQYRRRLAAVAVLSAAGDQVGSEGEFGPEHDPSIPLYTGNYRDIRPEGPFGLRRDDTVTIVGAGPNLSEEELCAILCFPMLRRLDLSGRSVRPGPWAGNVYQQEPGVFDRQLRDIAKLQAIEELNLQKTPVTDGGIRYIAELRKLRKLSVNSASITDRGIRHLTGLRALEELNLDGTSVRDEGVRRLAALPSLRILELDQTNVTGATFASLSPALEYVSLNDNNVGDELFPHLARFPNMKLLGLTRTRVSSAGLKTLPRCAELRYFYLDETRVSDEGLESLRQCGSLEHLGLRGCAAITDAGLVHLGKIESLKQVDIHGTAVTEAGAATLHELLPHAYIYWGPLGESVQLIGPN